MTLSVALTPAEIKRLPGRDLARTTCVVFDVLRATSTMLGAFAAGARAIVPVADIAEALRIKATEPEVLLAGERDGRRITRALSGSIDFDLGNSPREMTSERVGGRIVVTTTTNGTRAIHACAGGREVFIAAFANLQAMSDRLLAAGPEELLLVCSGTNDEAALEDVAGAGALIERLLSAGALIDLSDSAWIARAAFRAQASQSESINARRLLAIPELAEDVEWCLTPDRCELVASLGADGRLRVA